MSDGMPAERLLRLPVRLRRIPLGRPVDVVLDLDNRRAIGLEVLCGDQALRYLPLAAARVRQDEIAIRSALLLFEERDLAWYRRRARSLRDLRGTPVRHGRLALGSLADVLIGPDGALVGLLVDEGERVRRVALDDAITLAGSDSASAA